MLVNKVFLNKFITLLINLILNVQIWYVKFHKKQTIKRKWMRIMPFLIYSLNYANPKKYQYITDTANNKNSQWKNSCGNYLLINAMKKQPNHFWKICLSYRNKNHIWDSYSHYKELHFTHDRLYMKYIKKVLNLMKR